MAVKKRENTFEKLNKIDVSKFTEKKGMFNYLSWAHAVRELLKHCPEATWEVHTFKGPDGTDQPYMKNGTGAYVQVSVDVDGIIRSQIHPVLDNRNNTIENPNAFQINTSIQRCLAKAIALHGLGLYIFAGEDLPEPDKLTDKQRNVLQDLASKCGDKDVESDIWKAVDNGTIHRGNYSQCVEKLENMIKEQKEKNNGK